MRGVRCKEANIMLDFNSILVFSGDPKKLADFYPDNNYFQLMTPWEG
jgi:hypothetical protein